MITILFAAGQDRWPTYKTHLSAAIAEAGIEASVVLEADPATVDYIVYAPGGTVEDFTPYMRTKAVLNLWAGVERIIGNPTLVQPLARMVDPALTQSMVEYVTAHVLRHHLGIDAHIHGLKGKWQQDVPPLASDRTVTVLGLGALGQTCATTLAHLGFSVTGWSRGEKSVAGIRCRNGEAGLDEALAEAEILVLLLPKTPETEDLLNAQRLALMPKGAAIINPGRGALIDDEALLRALDDGHIGHATLDVFRQEPLPQNHPYWAHPRVTVTPHIAAETRPATAARVIAENIRRGETGEPFLHLVDRSVGY